MSRRCIKHSGAWKKVNFDKNLFSGNNIEDLVSFEELDDYELFDQVLFNYYFIIARFNNLIYVH